MAGPMRGPHTTEPSHREETGSRKRASAISRGTLPPRRSARNDDCPSAKRAFRRCSEARGSRVEEWPARGGIPVFAAPWRSSRKGFTLVEILIAVLILGIVLSTVYASYTGTFRIIGETRDDAEMYGMARSALDRMTRDLQSAAPWRGAFTFLTKADTLGGREFLRLTFRAAAHVAFNDREVPGGIAVIEYRLEEGTEKTGYVLLRSDSLTRDPGKEEPLPGGFALCDRVEELTYRFTDEAGKEYETWDSGGQVEAQRNRAPAGILIRLTLVNTADKERPYRFMAMVRIPFNRPEA